MKEAAMVKAFADRLIQNFGGEACWNVATRNIEELESWGCVGGCVSGGTGFGITNAELPCLLAES
jgi:hypothetical protein